MSVKTCKQHANEPIFIYAQCAACEIQRYRDEVKQLKAENERLERNRDMWKGQVELQAEELTSMRKDAEQWRALVGRAKDPVIGYTGCVICGSADHGGWSCQNHPGGKS